jgi:hypothetical protein
MDKTSREWWRELKTYEYKSCKLDSRCCRQAKLGAVQINPKPDPILLYSCYMLNLKYCPECGKELT